MISGLIVKIIANAAALWVAGRYIPGFNLAAANFPAFQALDVLGITPLIETIIAGGIVLAIANAILQPILKAVAALIPLITTAMLLVAANFAILYLADLSLPFLALSGWKPTLLAALLFGIVNTVL